MRAAQRRGVSHAYAQEDDRLTFIGRGGHTALTHTRSMKPRPHESTAAHSLHVDAHAVSRMVCGLSR
jgi:hypothetical protein